MPKVIGSASGNNLKITIPERGEKNWDELIENSCFTPISNHSHTGNGDGAKIDTDALEDGAVTTDKITDANVTEAKLDSAVQTKLSNIATNTSNISTNTSNIATNTSSIANLSIPSVLSDLSNVSSTAPTSGQVLSWNGTSWTPATSSGGAGGAGGDVDTDVIANASDASSYSGTARFIHITSTTNVTFSNTTIKDRLIYCENNITITFSTENFFRNTVFHRGTLRIESPHTLAGIGAADTNIRDCEIVCDQFYCKAGSVYDSMMEENASLDFKIYNTSIRAYLSIDFEYNTIGYGIHENYTCQFLTRTIGNDSNTLAIDCDRTVIQADHIKGAFSTYGVNMAVAHGTPGITTATIIEGNNTLINGSYQQPFHVIGPNLSTQVNVIASSGAVQTIPSNASTKVIFETEELDNTSSYNTTTGIFTAPVKGVFAVSSQIMFNSTSELDAGEGLYLQLRVNSSLKLFGSLTESVVTNTQSVLYGSQLSCILNLDAGDTVDILAYQGSGVSLSLYNNTAYNYFHINKVN